MLQTQKEALISKWMHCTRIIYLYLVVIHKQECPLEFDNQICDSALPLLNHVTVTYSIYRTGARCT